MQVTLYSEDNPQGLTAEWPVIPREGDFIEFHKADGLSFLKVDSVTFYVNHDGSFHSASVDLSTAPRPT